MGLLNFIFRTITNMVLTYLAMGVMVLCFSFLFMDFAHASWEEVVGVIIFWPIWIIIDAFVLFFKIFG